MKVKGTAVKALFDYVVEKHGASVDSWIDNLPIGSRKIYRDTILSTNWYDCNDAILEPMKVLAEMFYPSIHEAARLSGKYSADKALSGVYKVFVRVASPAFIIGKASVLMSTYYDPAETQILEKLPNYLTLKISLSDAGSDIIFYRIQGWIERALEIVKAKDINIKTDIDNFGFRGFSCVYTVKWS